MDNDMKWVPHGNGETKSVFLKIGEGYYGFEDFIQESIEWCKENNLTYRRTSYDTIRFSKDRDLIVFLLRFG